MEIPKFPIEKTKQRPAGLSMRAEQLPVLYRYVDSTEAGGEGGPGYNSLQDYLRILIRHKMTLLTLTVVRLLAAILIRLVHTPIYRVRTSFHIQDAHFPGIK